MSFSWFQSVMQHRLIVVILESLEKFWNVRTHFSNRLNRIHFLSQVVLGSRLHFSSE